MTRIKSPILPHPHAATCSEGDNLLVTGCYYVVDKNVSGQDLGDVDMLTSSISARWNIHYFPQQESEGGKVCKMYNAVTAHLRQEGKH